MREIDLLFGQISDKYHQAMGRNIICATDFLDLQKQSMAKELLDKDFAGQGFFFGGYEDAERKKLFFFPDYIEAGSKEEMENVIKEYGLIKVLRVERPKEGKALSHRDYLGSLMAEGIKREVLGDILVSDQGADIIVTGEMASYLEDNYSMAGRVSLKTYLADIDVLNSIVEKTKEIRDAVPSLRLDAVLSSAFGISRGKAQDAIRMGITYVNGCQIMKADKTVAEGDKLVIRGKGKAKLREISGKSKKDRIYIIVDRYI